MLLGHREINYIIRIICDFAQVLKILSTIAVHHSYVVNKVLCKVPLIASTDI